MLLLAFGRGRPRRPLRVLVPVSWLAVGVIFLVGFRVGLNVTNSNVIDVGYAGVIGADKLIHDKPLYGNWPKDNASGDTYGPVTYYAYVPFRAIFGWSGTWDDLPAAHAAAIVFDLLTLFGLFLLGRRIRGPTLGVVLAYAWAAYPFTLWSLGSNTNDSLVALLLVADAARDHLRAGARGRGRARRPDQVRAARARAAVAARNRIRRPAGAQSCALRGRVRADGRRRDAAGAPRRQLARVLARHDRLPGRPHLAVLDLGPVGRPRRRAAPRPGRHRGARDRGRVRARAGAACVEVAALGAAILIALQLGAGYWLYSYIVWFFPFVIVALFGSFPTQLEQALASSEVDRGADVPARLAVAAP